MMIEESVEQYPWRIKVDDDDILSRVEWFDVEQVLRALERDIATWQDETDREIPGRLRLCQDWIQQYAAHQPQNESKQHISNWQERLQRVSREYSRLLVSHPLPSEQVEQVDLLQKIFGPRSPPPAPQSSHLESESTNDMRIEPSIPTALPSESATPDVARRRKVPPPSTSAPALPNNNSNAGAELQAAQKEQMEAAVAEMAQQMKDRTRHIHEQLQQQNQQLLQNLETTLLDNQEQLTQVTAQTQAHVRKQWYRSFSNWTMLLVMVASFAATLLLILVIPKQSMPRGRRYWNDDSVRRNDRPKEWKVDPAVSRIDEKDAPVVLVASHIETQYNTEEVTKELEEEPAVVLPHIHVDEDTEADNEKQRLPDAKATANTTTAPPLETFTENMTEDKTETTIVDSVIDGDVPESPEISNLEDTTTLNNVHPHVNNDEDETTVINLAYRDAATSASSGNLDRLQHLLASWPVLLEIQDQNGWTLLHEAARNGLTHVVEYLLHRMISLNQGNILARTVQGQTALDIARDKFVGESHHPTILALERAMVLANDEVQLDSSNQVLLAQKDSDHSEAAATPDPPHTIESIGKSLDDVPESEQHSNDKHLLAGEEKIDPILLPMEGDVFLESIKIVHDDSLIEEEYNDEEDYGEEEMDDEGTEDVDEAFPFDYFVEVMTIGDVNALRNLLDSHPGLIAEVDPSTGYSLLHVAAQHDRASECVKMLLEYGSDVWYPAGESDLTALDVAIASFPDNNHHPIILLLQEAMGFRNMFGSLDGDGNTQPNEANSLSGECEIDVSTGECRVDEHQQPPPPVEMDMPPQKSSDDI